MVKRGFWAVVVYILLGAIGIPVFSGFSGGFGVILGTTGGYIVGFLFTALIMRAAEKWFGQSTTVFALSAVAGLAVCYLFGTVWYLLFYLNTTGPISILTVLGWCVFPFIIPDLVKIGLAVVLSRQLSKAITRQRA